MKLSVSKKSFRPAEQVFRTFIRSENLGFQWCGETGEAPPVADQASLFRGRLPISGYKVSADWLEPTVYPFLGFPRTSFLTVFLIALGRVNTCLFGLF